MKQLNKPAENMGGLIRLWAIPADKVTLAGKEISIASAENVYEIKCSEDTMLHMEQSELTSAGTCYNTTVKGFAPGLNEDTEKALEYMNGRKWVVLMMDGNGFYKLAGSREVPLRLEARTDTGQNTVDRAGCEFTFFGKTLKRAISVNYPF